MKNCRVLYGHSWDSATQRLPGLCVMRSRIGKEGEMEGAFPPRPVNGPGLTFPRKIPTRMTEVWKMGSQEDAALVRRGYEAFISGDMDTLMDQYTEDSVWHVGGSGPLSGDKKGRDALMAYFGELAARTNGSLKITLEDVTAGDRYTVGVHTYHAERDGKSIDQRSVLVFSISGDKVI